MTTRAARSHTQFSVRTPPSRQRPTRYGAKGCGEAGCAGSLTSIMNAINDALAEYGIRNIDMPATPQRVWQTIQEAKTAKAA